MKINELANTGREIIGDMYRWGVLDETYVFNLDEMTDGEVIGAVVMLYANHYIRCIPVEDPSTYYVDRNLIWRFIDADLRREIR